MSPEQGKNFLDSATQCESTSLSRLASCRWLTTTIRISVLLVALTCLLPAMHAQGPTTVDYPGCGFTSLSGINNKGQIVGSCVTQAFSYESGVFVPINAAFANGISDAGQIVGSTFVAIGNPPNGAVEQGYLDNGGIFTPITVPGAPNTLARGISSNGTYIVGKDGAGLTLCCDGFLYAGGTFARIFDSSFSATSAAGVNNSGHIVGTVGLQLFGSVYHGFLYNGGVFTLLDFPGATSTAASGINNNGAIVGSYADAALKNHGFIYSGGIFASFDFPGATGTLVNGINDNGTIVGSYSDAAGNFHGFFYDYGVQGYINPKYMIVGVTYAPPGSQSSVTYTDSVLVGNSTTIKDSFTDQTSVTVSVSVEGKIPGFTSGKVTGSFANTYAQTSSSSNMVTVNKATQVSDRTQGPSNSFVSINHDFDVIWLWLNPVLPFSFLQINPQAITWGAYGYDVNDQPGLDIFPVYVGWLNGDIPVPADVAAVLARSWASAYVWAPGEGPGLTGPGPGTDFATIAEADPFWQCNQAPAQCPAAADLTRFTLTDNQNIVYVQAPPGGQPITQTYQLQYQNISVQGQGTSSTHSQTFGLDVTFSGGPFWAKLSEDFKDSHMLTWMTSVDTSITNNTTSTALASITGPTCTASNGGCSPQYTGPTELEIYQDNQYGTFMFLPVPGTGVAYTLSTSPSSLSVGQGGQGTSTITITPANGFSGSVSLSASGLPNGVTAAFNPNPATSTSTLTLTASRTATTGAATITVTGTSGSLTQSTSPTLMVTPASSADFTISANPATVTISAPGQSGTTTITITSTGGLSQPISFTGGSCSGLPTGASCSFSPVNVTPSGAASSTLTIATTGASTALRRQPPGGIFFAMVIPGLLILGAGCRGKRKSEVARAMLLVLLAGFLLISINSCGGGGSAVGSGVGNAGGTSAGTYTITVMVSASGLSHSTPVTLTIQ